MHKLPEAAEILRKSIALQPDFVGAHATLAIVLQQMGDAQAAAAERRASAELSTKKNNLQGAQFNTNSGIRLLKAGDLDGAIGQFESALKLTPDYAPAHYELSIALKRKGDISEAQKHGDRGGGLRSAVSKPQLRNRSILRHAKPVRPTTSSDLLGHSFSA